MKEAYTSSLMNHYDDLMTGSKWWSHLYMHLFWGIDDQAIAQELLSMIPDDFQGKILDIPIGTAVFTAEKYRRMPHATIIGVDYSMKMLDLAMKRLGPTSNVALSWGDVSHLGYPDNSFDTVLSMNGFHVFPDKKRAFTETYRVLKPGGKLYACFYVKGERPIVDLFVRHILDKKGLFTPPHYSLSQIEDFLHEIYGDRVKVKNSRSIALIECTKQENNHA